MVHFLLVLLLLFEDRSRSHVHRQIALLLHRIRLTKLRINPFLAFLKDASRRARAVRLVISLGVHFALYMVHLCSTLTRVHMQVARQGSPVLLVLLEQLVLQSDLRVML